MIERFIAPLATEDEENGRQQRQFVEFCDDSSPSRAHEAVPSSASAAVPAGAETGVRADSSLETLVDVFAVRREQRHQISADGHVVVQRNRTVFGHDDVSGAANLSQPGTELFRVRHGCRQADKQHVSRQVDDDLFPHRSAEPVPQVVHFIEHHETEFRQISTGIDHVAQNLGRHDDDLRIAVDARIPRQQTNAVSPVRHNEFIELLVGQSLNRRGVEDTHSAGNSQRNRELSDNSLTGTRGCGNKNRVIILQTAACAQLEVIEFVVQGTAESLQW